MCATRQAKLVGRPSAATASSRAASRATTNTVVGDGCSPGCEAEPVCTRPIDADGCSSSCGDGILIDV